MEFLKGTELSDSQKKEVSRVFAESFFQWFSYFSKDVECLAKGFEDIFIWEKFYFAVIDKKIAGMASVSFKNEPCIRLNKSRLKRELGFFKGLLAFHFLKAALENHKYPFPISGQTASIEYVAVSSTKRRKGVAQKLLEYIISLNMANHYILEVGDTNIPAVELYKKTGFKVFCSIPDRYSKKSGINNFLYMEKFV